MLSSTVGCIYDSLIMAHARTFSNHFLTTLCLFQIVFNMSHMLYFNYSLNYAELPLRKKQICMQRLINIHEFEHRTIKLKFKSINCVRLA